MLYKSLQVTMPAVCITFFAVVLLVACKEKPAPTRPKEAPPTVVDVIVASQQGISNTVEANGSVVANEFVELHPEVSGRLTYLNVQEGRNVAQGTVIARVNDADLQAQLAKSRVQLDLAQKTEQRYKKLIDINGLNQADYDAVVNQVNSLKADIQYTQTLIDKTVVRAPFSGVLGLRQVSPGAFVTASTVLVTIQQVQKVKIDFTIPEEYSELIKKGSLVDVEVDAGEQVRKKALVIATEPQVNQATRNLKVRAILQNGTANPGAFVKVFVEASGNKKAVMIPTNSIIPDDKNNQVILVKAGKASFVNVKTGVRESNNVEIVSGIQPGDSVVVTGVLFARPKAPLKVRAVKTLEQLAQAQ
ncbi:MAG TPA: efflux RND transporter periplasmic adaptor subunit [Chitinophagaceae bacterium]|nr:efflux RND transporter periplasmic adaptor subunit [Chitinophagaceae bacterium]